MSWRVAAVLITLAGLPTGVAVSAQEKPVPRDSSRLTVPGCARDRAFTVLPPASRVESSPIAELGRQFRLNGPRALMDEIKKRQATMVELTGLVKKSDLAGPGGISMLGGRVRIGGAAPRDPIRDPMYNQVVMDVESFRSLPDSCPSTD